MHPPAYAGKRRYKKSTDSTMVFRRNLSIRVDHAAPQALRDRINDLRNAARQSRRQRKNDVQPSGLLCFSPFKMISDSPTRTRNPPNSFRSSSASTFWGQQRAAHGADAACKGCGPDCTPDDLLIFDMKDQRAGRTGKKVQQIHTLRRSLLHGQDSGHPDHQQASAADAEAR